MYPTLNFGLGFAAGLITCGLALVIAMGLQHAVAGWYTGVLGRRQRLKEIRRIREDAAQP